MDGKALGTTLLAAMGMIHSLCAAIDTNTVDWTSTEAVLAYIDGLVNEFGTAGKIPRDYLKPIRVSADDLWQRSFDFDIQTNDYVAATAFVNHKEEVLRVISNHPTFRHSETNCFVAATFIRKIQPIKDAPRSKALPRPFKWNTFEIKPDDPPEYAEKLRGYNEIIATSNAVWAAAYEEDQVKQVFFRRFHSFYFYLSHFAKPYPH